uniref:Secreted protein n=1 Tax=Trichogramma kaykai TaxID=54128 RepID=A0ABD2W8V6_9HYME
MSRWPPLANMILKYILIFGYVCTCNANGALRVFRTIELDTKAISICYCLSLSTTIEVMLFVCVLLRCC